MAGPSPAIAFVAPQISVDTPLGRRRLALRLHFSGVVVHQLLRDAAGRELPLRDLADRGHLGGGAGDEALGEAGKLLGPDAPLDHLDVAPARQVHRGGASDASKEAVSNRGMDLAVFDKED